MCLSCWDADKMEEKLKGGEDCDGGEMAKMSIDELKTHILEEWSLSKKTDFRVFKQAVPQMKHPSLFWETPSPLNKQETLKIKINFI